MTNELRKKSGEQHLSQQPNKIQNSNKQVKDACDKSLRYQTKKLSKMPENGKICHAHDYQD